MLAGPRLMSNRTGSAAVSDQYAFKMPWVREIECRAGLPMIDAEYGGITRPSFCRHSPIYCTAIQTELAATPFIRIVTRILSNHSVLRRSGKR
jgi:hypothetical protein